LNQADGIHPTKAGYEVIVEQVLKVIRPMLNERAHQPSAAHKLS
jgi:acyl-CoA thioesterase I